MNALLKPYVITGPHGRWQATAGEVKKLFGLREEQPWPEKGMPMRQIGMHMCWVYPIEPKFKIRAMCSCRLCGKAVPIGRLVQHLKSHDNPAMIKRLENERTIASL